MTDTRELVELDNYLRDPNVGLPWGVRIKISDTITALSEQRGHDSHPIHGGTTA